jgi:hypothetical protein
MPQELPHAAIKNALEMMTPLRSLLRAHHFSLSPNILPVTLLTR